METYKELILQYSNQNESFNPTDLFQWLCTKGAGVKNTMNCVLSRMIDEGKIVRIARGKYAASSDKNVFAVKLSDKEKNLAFELKERFPFASICLYNGKALSSLQHHLSNNCLTYVETDRDAIEPVFESLRERSDKVWLVPSADMVYRYIDLSHEGIIVKPLVTEAPTAKINGILIPTLEKLLVDIRKDTDFSYLQGAEVDYMWENAKALYQLNTTRLNRYARRRGLKIDEIR